MDFGDLIYYLAFIAFFVISALSKKRKKAREQQEDRSTPTVPAGRRAPQEPHDIDTILGKLLDRNRDPEPAAPTPQPEPKPIPEPVVITTPRKTQQVFDPTLEGQRSIAVHDYEPSEVEPEPTIDFDVREAVIYSETLKRPYV